MSLLMNPVQPPAQIRKQHLARGMRVKRIKDRRIFRVVDHEYERMVAEIVPLAGGTPRSISREDLARDFIEVARCAACGWHHDIRKPPTCGRRAYA